MTPLEKQLMGNLHKAAATKFEEFNALREYDPESAALEYLQREWEDAELKLAVFREELLDQRQVFSKTD